MRTGQKKVTPALQPQKKRLGIKKTRQLETCIKARGREGNSNKSAGTPLNSQKKQELPKNYKGGGEGETTELILRPAGHLAGGPLGFERGKKKPNGIGKGPRRADVP